MATRRDICFTQSMWKFAARKTKTTNAHWECACAHQLNRTQFDRRCDVNAMHERITISMILYAMEQCEQRKLNYERTNSDTDEHVNRECVSKCNYCWNICARSHHSVDCRQLVRSKKIKKNCCNFLFAFRLGIENSFCIRFSAISFLFVNFANINRSTNNNNTYANIRHFYPNLRTYQFLTSITENGIIIFSLND